MKKIKSYVLGILLAMVLSVSLTACGSNDNGTETTMATTQAATTEMKTTTESGNTTTTKSNMGESSTGVIDGAINDVENGVKDVMDPTTATGR